MNLIRKWLVVLKEKGHSSFRPDREVGIETGCGMREPLVDTYGLFLKGRVPLYGLVNIALDDGYLDCIFCGGYVKLLNGQKKAKSKNFII